MLTITIREVCSEKLLTWLEFKPKYYAHEKSEDGCWAHIYEKQPVWVPSEGGWATTGNWYELGFDESVGLKYTPKNCRDSVSQSSLREIVYE